MKTKTINMDAPNSWSPTLAIKALVLGALLLASIQGLQAQDTQAQYSKPNWWFGIAGGVNFNFFGGSTQQMNDGLRAPTAFHDGYGVGMYIAPLVEYHFPDSRFGVMFQAGFDGRKGRFDQVTTPCDCPQRMTTNLSYITLEPSLRFAPFKGNLYLYAGPRWAVNMDKEFDYQLGTNPAIPGQEEPAGVKGNMSHVRETIISGQIGAGYDIPISSRNNMTQFVLSPFVSYHPYFGQDPRSVETWNVSTVRAGIALKFGQGHRVDGATADGASQFTISSPSNGPESRRSSEIFPLRNYVFFNLGSTAIPSRYELLRKDQVADFKEDQLEVKPQNLAGRSQRQLDVYYNVLNILGDRMNKNPSANITLVGSSEKGPDDGKLMAEAIKTYLVNVFSISPARISVQGRTKPVNPSEQPGGTLELGLLREGDRRVSIESNSPVLLMEYQSGPTAPLRPVVIAASQIAPPESYVVFDNKGAKAAFSSWTLELKDEKGKVQTFGPYTEDSASIPGNLILGTRPSRDYKAKMIGVTKSGKLSEKEANVHVVLWTPATAEAGVRYSIIYDFNESKATSIYEKYLSEIVMPKIPVGGKVIIHGHTDVIGDTDYNQRLSIARADDVKSILTNSLKKAGRKDVKFETSGSGENESAAPFENKFPEERFYNRTVIVDIIPMKKGS